MRIQSALLSAVTAAAALGFGLAAKADTVPASCDLYAPREDYPVLSSACTFSQRQGFVTITLKDGTTYELTPSPTQAATYTDQNGRPATREDELGTAGAIYRLADVSIYVYWDASTVSSEPRRGEGNVPCSADTPSYNLMCRAAAIYGDPGNSALTVVGPTGNVLHLYYYGETLYSVNPSDRVLVQMVDGQYLVSVNDAEFFQLDATIVTGVD